MRHVDQEVDRNLTLLRNKIRERGFTQLEVQEALGWGRSYISQLLTKQKALRVEQVLLILDVIGVAPATYFSELYGTSSGYREERPEALAVARPQTWPQFEETRALLRGLVDVLLARGLVTLEDLSAAAEVERQSSSN